MNYKTSNGQTTASCSGVIEENGFLPQRLVDMRKIEHLAKLLDYCPGVERASQIKVAHAVFWALFCNMKGVVLRDGNMILASRSKRGLRQLRWGKWLFIEQNPKTDSKWAKMVHAGNRVMWVINVEDSANAYVARVVNGQLIVL